MKVLDLYCGAGGAAKGYADAGFDVVGVDILPQANYPFRFIQTDALSFLKDGIDWFQDGTSTFDLIHASPPCQAYSYTQRIRGNDHPDLIDETRKLLIESGVPYVIENVLGAPLIDPVTLCGNYFGLRTYRHRLFETSWHLPQPPHKKHEAKNAKMGRPPQEGEFIHVAGNFSGVKEARKAMGIDWMTRNELKQSIPPAYTKYIGEQYLEYLAKC
jgi:DNA (cytosine-5)-methyltransferase 1